MADFADALHSIVFVGYATARGRVERLVAIHDEVVQVAAPF